MTKVSANPVRFLKTIVALGCIALTPEALAQTTGIDAIQHVIVIYQENWSFDGLYGKFPGADGIANADDHVRQVKKDGTPYLTLPQPLDTAKKPSIPDPRFPADLPVAPYDAARFVPPDQKTGDIVNHALQEERQINGGRMDGFVAWSDNGGLALSYYDATELPVGRLALQYTLADRFFHSAFDGSLFNHFWLVCACTPVWANAPDAVRVQLDAATGTMIKDGAVTPDGYAVNTAYSVNEPHPVGSDPTRLVPNQTAPTIGDRLDEKAISWKWYSGGWNAALAGHPDPLFQFHHQVFAYFARYADGQPAKAQHLRDEQEFFADLQQGMLPSVAFIKPLGPDNEHPGYASLVQGQQHVQQLVAAVMNSPYWADSAIIITYDEHGGRWDHVAPPKVDRWGPGSRVPAIIISRYAKRHYVDHTQYDTTSILKLMEDRWNLLPLASRDARAGDLRHAFNF